MDSRLRGNDAGDRWLSSKPMAALCKARKKRIQGGKAGAIVGLGEKMSSPEIGEEPCQRGPTRERSERAGEF